MGDEPSLCTCGLPTRLGLCSLVVHFSAPLRGGGGFKWPILIVALCWALRIREVALDVATLPPPPPRMAVVEQPLVTPEGATSARGLRCGRIDVALPSTSGPPREGCK